MSSSFVIESLIWVSHMKVLTMQIDRHASSTQKIECMDPDKTNQWISRSSYRCGLYHWTYSTRLYDETIFQGDI